jgi:hypothetical protein
MERETETETKTETDPRDKIRNSDHCRALEKSYCQSLLLHNTQTTTLFAPLRPLKLGSKEHESGVFFYFYTSLTLVDGVLLCKGTVIEPNRCLVFLYTPKPKGDDKLFVVTKQLNESGKVELLAVGDIKVAQADLIRSDDREPTLGRLNKLVL